MAEEQKIDALKLKKRLRDRVYKKYYSNRKAMHESIANNLDKFVRAGSEQQNNS